jgi:hypothetical protein
MIDTGIDENSVVNHGSIRREKERSVCCHPLPDPCEKQRSGRSIKVD